MIQLLESDGILVLMRVFPNYFPSDSPCYPMPQSDQNFVTITPSPSSLKKPKNLVLERSKESSGSIDAGKYLDMPIFLCSFINQFFGNGSGNI